MAIIVPQGSTVGSKGGSTRTANRGDRGAVPLLTHKIIQLADADAGKVMPVLRLRSPYATAATGWFNSTFYWKPFLFQEKRPDYFRKESGELLWQLISLRYGKRHRDAEALVQQIRSDAEAYFKAVLLAELEALPLDFQPDDVRRLRFDIRRGTDIKTLASSSAASEVVKQFGSIPVRLRVLIHGATELFQ